MSNSNEFCIQNFYNLSDLDSTTLGINKEGSLSANLAFWPLEVVLFKAIRLPIFLSADSNPNVESFAVI